MRVMNHLLIFPLLLICSVAFCTRAEAAPTGKAVAVKGESQAPGETPGGSPPMQEHKIALAPFYRLQSNGSNVWVERTLVTLNITAPRNCLQQDFDNPTFRKMFYELLQSGEPEATIQAQAVNHVKRQGGMKDDPAVQISRSILIVR